MDLVKVLRPNYHDKSARLEYLAQLIASNIVQFTAAVLFGLFAQAFRLGEDIFHIFILFVVFPLAMAYGAIASRKRLNDLGDPWWMIFGIFIPIVSLLLLVYLLFTPGKASPIAEDVGQKPLTNFTQTEKDSLSPPT